MMGGWDAHATVVGATHEVVLAGSRVGAEITRLASRRVETTMVHRNSA
jgi:hypothetical protein